MRITTSQELREKHRLAARVYRAKYPERTRAAVARYRAKNRLKDNEQKKLDARAFRKAHPEHCRNRWMKRVYGISLHNYFRILCEQDYKCACCACQLNYIGNVRGKLGIDHNHATNKVRAILCQLCNTGIGAFGDSITKLEMAIAYLRRHQ